MSVIRVVLADDQELVRSGFATILSAQPDIEVVGEAANGREAVALAQRLRPDVVLMDIRMPLLDGIEATRALVGPGSDGALKVLVLTTFSADEYVYESLRAGASGYLLKDATPADLIRSVRVVAAGDSIVDPAVTARLIGSFAQRVTPAAQKLDERRVSDALSALTPREREVFSALSRGLSNGEIASAFTLSPETVKTHVSRVLTKLGLRDRVHAVVFAHESGLVSPAQGSEIPRASYTDSPRAGDDPDRRRS
ncbi:LuxR family two component transcriptional regulator [Homoserinimonas aerilata]|uniref:LuxR family two component transcriptional regulator n=1 Tax=Homoserinimonas aerilata TaxID=1162970 RepID=A0A542YHA0_9MICO|nr:response regulator transcription factor [Homoserinimonas aerilata]TQL47436.1 LuxR family two component transcriptional regulator [Homoserinimonas aerilata]